MSFEQPLAYAAQNADRFLQTLFRLIAQPSISSENVGVRECALMEKELLESAGLENVRLFESPGHPFIYADWLHAPGAPTVLFYGHYDVQPARDEEWDSPAFTPIIRNGRIYGRGVGDNKGQHLAHICAIESCLKTLGRLPVNVKLLLEGEEENGSPHIDAFVLANRELLKSDLVYTSDGGQHESGAPTVVLGVRGILYVDLKAKAAKQDYHSGNKGNLVPNAAWKLVHLLAGMKDPVTDRVLIPGFYDRVRDVTAEELELLARIPYNEAQLAAEHGLKDLGGRDGAAVFRRVIFEPTLNICGFHSGMDGPGMKTSIPAEARAKVDMRLVLDQSPDEIWERFTAHCRRVAPEIEVTRVADMKPSRTSASLPVVQSVVEAVRAGSGLEPVVLPSLGGSLPDYVFTGILGAPSVVVPYANFDENNHGPNENMKVELFHQGIRTTIHLLHRLG